MSLPKLQVMSWVYLAILTLGALVFHSAFFSWSVFVGGVISILSFWVSHNDVTRFFGSLTATGPMAEKEKVKKSRIGYIVKFWVRIVIIGIVLLVLIKYKKVNICLLYTSPSPRD